MGTKKEVIQLDLSLCSARTLEALIADCTKLKRQPLLEKIGREVSRRLSSGSVSTSCAEAIIPLIEDEETLGAFIGQVDVILAQKCKKPSILKKLYETGISNIEVLRCLVGNPSTPDDVIDAVIENCYYIEEIYAPLAGRKCVTEKQIDLMVRLCPYINAIYMVSDHEAFKGISSELLKIMLNLFDNSDARELAAKHSNVTAELLMWIIDKEKDNKEIMALVVENAKANEDVLEYAIKSGYDEYGDVLRNPNAGQKIIELALEAERYGDIVRSENKNVTADTLLEIFKSNSNLSYAIASHINSNEAVLSEVLKSEKENMNVLMRIIKNPNVSREILDTIIAEVLRSDYWTDYNKEYDLKKLKSAAYEARMSK